MQQAVKHFGGRRGAGGGGGVCLSCRVLRGLIMTLSNPLPMVDLIGALLFCVCVRSRPRHVCVRSRPRVCVVFGRRSSDRSLGQPRVDDGRGGCVLKGAIPGHDTSDGPI